MKLSFKLTIAITAGFVLLSATGCSKDKTMDTSSTQSSRDRNAAADRSPSALNSTDRDFAVIAAQAGMAEVELGNLAQTQGSNEQIRSYGKKLVEDHAKLNNELKDIAAKQALTLPSDVNSDQRKAIDAMARRSGPQFDSEFWKTAVDDHAKAIEAFRKEVAMGDNQALKDFASRSIPSLEEHLRMAQNKGAN
jgi:putative membrane protein